jgi:acetyl esterase
MKKLLKILLAIPIVLIVLIFIIWLLIRQKPEWDDQTGHSTIENTIETDEYTQVENVLWASPNGFNLTMDIYTPKGDTESYPVIVMFHGGGWLINDNSIMDQGSAYMASTGRYVVCNVNYRLLRDMDNTVKLNEIIEDAFGSLLWVKENISRYGGDPDRIIVTGDSAGGQLATVVTTMGQLLTSSGYDNSPSGFRPTWLPEGRTAEQTASEYPGHVDAAILSYGVSDLYRRAQDGYEDYQNFFWYLASCLPRGLFGDEINHFDNPDYYKMASPWHNIPDTATYRLPPIMVTVGEKDPLVKPVDVRAYADKLLEAGHAPVTYWEYPGQSHAFLDSGENFEKNAIPAFDVMIGFMDGIFYP